MWVNSEWIQRLSKPQTLAKTKDKDFHMDMLCGFGWFENVNTICQSINLSQSKTHNGRDAVKLC